MEILIKAAAFAITGAVMSLLLKKNSPEIALLMTIALSCVVIYLALDIFSAAAGFMDELSSMAGLSGVWMAAVMKIVGVAILTKLASGICADAGQGSAASALELLGSAAALYTALPLMKTVLQMVNSLL